MDRQQRTFNVVVALNQYNSGELERYKLLDHVCEYFDYIKNKPLDDGDKRFLLHLSNKAGVPHYYDILPKFGSVDSLDIDDESFGLNTFSSLMYESTLFTDENSKLHQFQMEILHLFKMGKQNRFFLSASTSFGKTHLVYEVIKKMLYSNIVLIFPSIALLTENLAKIKEGQITFVKKYKIHTLSDIDNDYGENNIFIFTPERFLSFLDKKNQALKIDFIFIDEIYKIDNGYIIDDEVKENERDIAYRMALFYGLSKYPNIDLLLAGPYIEIFDIDALGYNPSFDLFLADFNIVKLLRNEYEIVKVSKTEIENDFANVTIDGIEFNFNKKKTKKSRIQEILDKLISLNENAIVYCNTKSNAEIVAAEYERADIDIEPFSAFSEHLKKKFDNSWIVIQALEKGIGVHHGVVPKYIQKEIVNLFNSKTIGINVLVSTTTITEGVNTTAKNMIVYKSQKGSGKTGKPLLSFDAKNIAGRAGRFMEHYKGRVISLDKEFLEKINQVGEQIKHKNYDTNSVKTEIDYEMTPSKFLDVESTIRLIEINESQKERGIPDDILSQFKVISKRDKLIIYDKIQGLPSLQYSRIKKLISRLNGQNLGIDKDGLQTILDLIYDIIQSENLKVLIDNKFKDAFSINSYSILFAALNSYLTKGFQGVYSFYLSSEKKKNNKNAVNSAMRQASNLIYNTFKYQLVKYLGVFNLMYKYIESQKANIAFGDTIGIDKLLIKLEYNAFSEEARIASDYGVPQKIIDYYDSIDANESKKILNEFDKYENQIYQKIKKIIEE